MEIKWSPSPNYTAGRRQRNIIAIVDHITAGSFPGCLSWLQNPAARASAHYLITEAGTVYQLVKESDSAWHAGAVNQPTWSLYDGINPNFSTIGIEHENLSGGALTEKQYQATLELHRELCDKYTIPKDREHIIGHYELDAVNRANCPGKYFPFARLIQDLNMEEGMKRYNKTEELPDWAKSTVCKLIANGILSGTGEGLNLSEDMLRLLVINDRAGLYGLE